MNKDLKPEDYLNEVYKYFCLSIKKDFQPDVKAICHIQACFEHLHKYVNGNDVKNMMKDKIIKVDGYNSNNKV